MSVLRRFHEDELGAPELSTILLIAFIVLPLLGLLIMYRDKIAEKTSELWDQVFGAGSKSLRGPG